MRGIVRTYDLIPDGVKIVVAWENMGVGTSIFVPCINTEKGKKQLKSVAKMKAWEFKIQICVENKKLGLRAWRTM